MATMRAMSVAGQAGTRVGVGWFPGACGYCRQSRHGNLFACENIQGAAGVTRDGGYATRYIRSSRRRPPTSACAAAGRASAWCSAWLSRSGASARHFLTVQPMRSLATTTSSSSRDELVAEVL